MLALFAVYALGVVRFIGPGAISAPALAGIAEGALIIGLRTFGEEYFFRAWLQPLVARSWGAPAAIAATSLLFGLLHLVSRNVPLVALVNISLAGAFFGLLAMRTGGLAAPFAAHWMWNAFEQCVFGLTPNPGVDRLGSLVDLDLVGPTLYSGGGDGLNGSLGTTAALLICVAALSLGWRVAVGHGSVAEAGHR
jgi:membrane protease YdiL (CAAX protease family)